MRAPPDAEMMISGRNLGVQIEERAILPGSPLTDREVGVPGADRRYHWGDISTTELAQLHIVG